MAYYDILTNVGLSIMTNRLKNAGTSPKYVAWGVGVAEAAVGDTALGSASAEARTAGTETQQTTNTTNDTYRVVGIITCTGAPKAITEMGLFDADTAGNLFVHSNFAAINVNVGDSISFTVNVVCDQA